MTADNNQYEPPRVTDYGGFEEITKGGGSQMGDGNSLQTKSGDGGST
jgi:hypothetical protein